MLRIKRMLASPIKLEHPARPTVFVYALSAAVLLIMGAVVLFVPYGWDHAVTSALNTYAHRSFWFDAACHAISENTMFSGMIFAALLWYCWFAFPDVHSRHKTLSGTLASAIAAMLSRVTQLMSPSRPRPFQDPSLHLKLPFTIKLDSLRHVASSFPSDHAALYFALAATIWSVNRKIGYYVFAFAALLDLIRMYLGFHYLSDLIGGAALGILCACVIQNISAASLTKRMSALYQAPTPAFYAVAYCVTYAISTMFFDVRFIALQIAHAIRH
jgi:membrane-associated phospholipid phosphatase